MIDHEKAVIGLILNNPENFSLAGGYIDTIDFSEMIPGLIWSEIKHLSNQGLEPSRHYVSNAFTDRLKDDAEPYLEYMADCCKYYEGDIHHHARVVRKQSKDRTFIYKLKIAPEQQKPDEFIIEALEEYQRTNEDRSKTFKQIITTVVDAIEAAQDGITGLKTHIPALDRITGGLQAGKVYTIAARPGVGKTALSNQILLLVAKNGSPVGNMSLEMSDDEIGFRSIANTCNANLTGLYRADDEALTRMSSGMKSLDLANWPVYINTDQDSLKEVVSQIRLWKIKYDIKLAVVDHVGLVKVRSITNRVDEITEVTRTIKKLSKELNIPIIQTCQISRTIDKSNREPTLSDLKGSGSIEEDTDVVIFLHEINNDAGYDHHKFIVAKNRSGEKGYAGQGFIFNGSTQTFTEMGYGDYS